MIRKGRRKTVSRGSPVVVVIEDHYIQLHNYHTLANQPSGFRLRVDSL